MALAGIVLTISLGCSKKWRADSNKVNNTSFTFRAKKNGADWKAGSLTATYNIKDSMMHIMAFGDHNERFTLSFFKKPQYTGNSKQFTAGSMIPICEYCAGIAQLYSLDSLRQNSFQIMGFDNIDNRIMGKFSVYLKKDSLYQGAFIKDSALYEGLFSVLYETVAF